jgi:hypothetical protein
MISKMIENITYVITGDLSAPSIEVPAVNPNPQIPPIQPTPYDYLLALSALITAATPLILGLNSEKSDFFKDLSKKVRLKKRQDKQKSTQNDEV